MKQGSGASHKTHAKTTQNHAKSKRKPTKTRKNEAKHLENSERPSENQNTSNQRKGRGGGVPVCCVPLHKTEPGPGLQRKSEYQYVHLLPNMEDWEQEEAWDSFPVNPTPTMTHAAHPVSTCDGSTNWFKYADAVEEWCDLTKVEARRRRPAIAARSSGRAEIFKERLNRDRLRDPETGVDYFLSTLRPFFVKDLLSVFLYRFFQMLRCNRGQTDHQRWMVKYEIARQTAVDAWLDATTPKPVEGEAAVVAQIGRLREAARDPGCSC